MANKLYEESDIQDIADAIRSKTGSSATYTVSQMAQAIENIPSGGGGDRDWTEIGYVQEPSAIESGFRYAKEILENWDEATTSVYAMFRNDKKLLFFPSVNSPNIRGSALFMFDGCRNIMAVGNLNTKNITDMQYMFGDCSFLSSIPNLNTSNVTNMYGMFSSCSALTAIPQLNTSKVTDMQRMFYNCSALTAIPQLDTSKVTNMNSMFCYCKNLTAIPQLDTSNVTDTQHMFYNCSALSSIPNLNTSMAISMTCMFSDCQKLVTVPQLNLLKATTLTLMFHNCDVLSNESLNNIMASCISATSYTSTKTLKYMGLSSTQATTCQSLSNYQAFLNAGWTTGY